MSLRRGRSGTVVEVQTTNGVYDFVFVHVAVSVTSIEEFWLCCLDVFLSHVTTRGRY